MKQKLLLLTLLAIGMMDSGALQGQTLTKRGLLYELHDDGTACLAGTTTKIIGDRTVDAEVKSGTKTYRVTVIRHRALAGQAYLTKLTINANLDSIGMGAFRDCTQLTEVVVSGNVKYLEAYAFANTAITQIDLSAWTPQKYGTGLLSDCKSLTEARLPATFTTLPDCTFSGCTSLLNPHLETLSLTAIGEHALCDCSSIETLQLPATVTKIGADAFSGMSSLKQPNLPQGVTSIGHLAFKNCTSLETIELPEALTSTGVSPFWGCTSLREVTLPAKLTGVEEKYMFDNCPALEKILVNTANTKYKSNDGVLCMRTQNMIVAYPAALSHTVHPTLPNASQPVAAGALIGCEMDETVLVPSLVTKLPREALAKTTGMKTFNSAESNASLKTIGEHAFHSSRDLACLAFSSRLTEVEKAAFQCAPIADIYLYSTNVPPMDYSTFDESTLASAMLHVPTGRTTTYKSSATWGRFANINDDGVTDIENLQMVNDEWSAQPWSLDTSRNGKCYDLSGRRVTNPTKGIYIVNGKKMNIEH